MRVSLIRRGSRGQIRGMTRELCVFGLVLGGLIWASPLPAQEFVSDALRSFPEQIIRVEYSSPAKLRTLPNYASLRQRYVGPRLQALEESFNQLGVREGDIDELLLGWQSGGEVMALGGFVAGRFNALAIADRAGAQGISPASIGGRPAHCVGSGATAACVVVLQDSLAAFGSTELLGTMLEAREGQRPNLTSDERLTNLVEEARKAAPPIWGVAVGAAVADWFRAWLPAQQNLQLDWGRAFQSVEALAYSVDAGDRVSLDAKLDCATSESATSTRQMLEGLRLFQQMAWQNLNPNRANPFQSLELEVNDRRVSLKLTAALADLEGAAALSAP